MELFLQSRREACSYACNQRQNQKKFHEIHDLNFLLRDFVFMFSNPMLPIDLDCNFKSGRAIELIHQTRVFERDNTNQLITTTISYYLI